MTGRVRMAGGTLAVAVDPVYVDPGAEATSVALAIDSLSLVADSPFNFTAVVMDASEDPVPLARLDAALPWPLADDTRTDTGTISLGHGGLVAGTQRDRITVSGTIDLARATVVRSPIRRWFLATGFSLTVLSACVDSDSAARDASAALPTAELHLAAEPDVVLDSAMALMRRDGTAGMVSVDADGRPRIRSVGSFLLDSASTPRERFTVFVYTRRSTRKIDQLARDPRVTLYYTDDARISYATLMGRAVVHRDPAHPRLQPFLDSATIAFFWPKFPDDFVMLEIRPDWLEFMGPGAWNHPETWRPQAVVFAPED